jgi:hypothetical protein
MAEVKWEMGRFAFHVSVFDLHADIRTSVLTPGTPDKQALGAELINIDILRPPYPTFCPAGWMSPTRCCWKSAGGPFHPGAKQDALGRLPQSTTPQLNIMTISWILTVGLCGCRTVKNKPTYQEHMPGSRVLRRVSTPELLHYKKQAKTGSAAVFMM